MHFSRGTLRLQGVYGVDVLPNAMVVVRNNDLVGAVQGRYMDGGCVLLIMSIVINYGCDLDRVS
jgi:hypothetical protein